MPENELSSSVRAAQSQTEIIRIEVGLGLLVNRSSKTRLDSTKYETIDNHISIPLSQD